MAAYTVDAICASDVRAVAYHELGREVEADAYANAAYARWFWAANGQIRDHYQRELIHAEILGRLANGTHVPLICGGEMMAGVYAHGEPALVA